MKKDINFLRFNLQHFGEGEDGAPSEPNEPKLLTPDEVQAQINAVIGKERASADKRMTDLQNSFDEKLAEAVQKQLNLAEMDDVARLQSELEDERKARLQIEAESKNSRIKTDALAIFADRNIPPSFIEFVLTDEAEDTLERINSLDEYLKSTIGSRVQAEVEKRLSGQAPHQSSSNHQGEDNPFITGNLTEQMILTKQNPELAATLKAAAKK